MNDLGYACIQWTVDTGGWMGTSGGESIGTVVSRVLGGLTPGEIVLMHVGCIRRTARPRCRRAAAGHRGPPGKGYGFTMVADLPPGGPVPIA